MDQKNVKKRDVLPYEEFVKARDTAMKAVMTKSGENPNPAAHDIKGEDLYVRNDANPYQAMGIKHDEKLANINNKNNANQVDVSGANENAEPTKAEIKAAEDAAALVGNASGIKVIEEGMSTANDSPDIEYKTEGGKYFKRNPNGGKWVETTQAEYRKETPDDGK
jgi:hypothetical protein